MYVLALTTGLRRGELLALRWDDLDLGSRQLHVRRAMQRVDGKLQIVEPKTSSARRTVVLAQFAARHLEVHKKRQDAERLALGDTWREHGLVFASSIGTPIEPRNVNRRWDELRRRAGLDGLRLHDLRHGCATFLLAQGVPARAIMDVLGHAEIGVTMNTYAKARELHQPSEIREVCPGTKGSNVVPTAPHRSFVTWDYATTSPPDARFARQSGKIMWADGRRGPGRPVQGQRVFVAPACGFGAQAAFKSISEDIASGPGR